MRRFFSGSHIVLSLVLSATLMVAGCGGGHGGSTLGPVASVTLLPANASVDVGGTLGISVLVKDAAGHTLLNHTVTFTSNNPNVQVADNGLLCAGTWDSLATPVVCTPAAGPTTAQIVGTSEGVMSPPLTVFVHQHIDSITLTPTSPACISQTQTLQYTATAFHGATDITSTVGGFNFAVANTNVATINSADQPTGQPNNQITAKAATPGQTAIVASNAGTVSLGAAFTTCGPAKITLHVTSSTDTAFTVAVNSTKQLTADVVDVNGTTITGLALSYESSTAATTVTSTGLVNGLSPGQSTITASCTPAGCNAGVNTLIFSNPVVATVTGTAVSTTAYVTSTGFGTVGCNNANATLTCTPQIIPITTSGNTAGTALPIPDVTISNVVTKVAPNSMVLSSGGGKLFIGSPQGLVVVDTTTNSQTMVLSTPGKVISASPGGTKAIVSDAVNNKTYVFDPAASAFETLNIGAATAAAWTPDGLKAYIVSGTTLYQYAIGQISLRTIPMGDTGESVDILPGGQFAYIATASGNMGARATCRNDSTYAPESVVSTDSGLQFVRGVTLAGAISATVKMLDVGGTKMTADTPAITPPTAGSDCPPGITSSAVSADWSGLGIASFTPRQLITLSTGKQAYVPSDQTVLLGYDVAANTTFTVAVGGASQFTGGALLDGTKVYVGGSDNAVHVIDTATKLQTATVPITFGGTTACDNAAICKPDLVAVQPK
jgi:YVTN family beta-propeller protein